MQTKVLYFLNSFNRGGAELGLKTLIDGKLFSDCALSIGAIVRGEGALLEDLEARGLSPFILVDRPDMRTSDLLRASIGLARKIRELRPDILILSLPQANIIGRFLGRLFGCPKIISFEHNSHLAKRAYEHLFRWTASCVDALFVDCEETGRVVNERFYKSAPKRMHVVPLVEFCDVPALPARMASPGPRLVAVGRLTEPKNHRAIIHAVDILKRRGIRARLDVLGEGRLRPALQALSTELGLAGEVSFPGFVSPWWSHAPYDAFILASRHEGLCIVALEAMWAGIPVIAPRIGGLRNYGTMDNMKILDTVGPEDIADAIERLWREEDTRTAVITGARQTVAERFSRHAVDRMYARLNHQLLTGTL